MKSEPRPRHLTLAALTIVLGIALTSCASAENPLVNPEPTTDSASEAPISAVDFAEGEFDDPVNVSVDGGDEGVGVTFREITIKPGATTGEHCHYGQLIAVVKEGDLTHYADIYEGGVNVYEAGEAIIEGAGYPHEGRNEGTTDVVLWVTYIIPEGKPLAETVLANCD